MRILRFNNDLGVAFIGEEGSEGEPCVLDIRPGGMVVARSLPPDVADVLRQSANATLDDPVADERLKEMAEDPHAGATVEETATGKPATGGKERNEKRAARAKAAAEKAPASA